MSACRTYLLIVDDEADFRQALAGSLTRQGYCVLQAANGTEALKIFESGESIAAVISDVRMPDGDGIELLERIRIRAPKMPVILLATDFSEVTVQQANRTGADAIFSKPLDRQSLRDVLRRLLTPTSAARQFERVPTDLEVEVRFATVPDSIQARALNLAEGGMFVAMKENCLPNVNDTVEFELRLHESRLEIQSTVRWVRVRPTPDFPAGCGVEFSNLEGEALVRLQEFIDESKTKSWHDQRS